MNEHAPQFTPDDLSWLDAGETAFRDGPEAAKLPPLDDRRIQRLWLGGFAIGWLEAKELITAPPDDPLGQLCHDDARAALTQRLAEYPALLAQLNTHGSNGRRAYLAALPTKNS